MKIRLILMIVMLSGILPAWAVNELDPNLSEHTGNLTEGRVLECQKCEAALASPVARHAGKASAIPQEGALKSELKIQSNQ